MKIDAIVLSEKDNVATSLRDLESGDNALVGSLERTQTFPIREKIPYGHKFAFKDIPKGEEVLKYGEVIGRSTCDIPSGKHVHVHNVESLRGRGDLKERGNGDGI
jgi:altronate dehydratase small subunit